MTEQKKDPGEGVLNNIPSDNDYSANESVCADGNSFWKTKGSVGVTRRNWKEEAIGRWPFILSALGINEKYLTNKHSPCPSPGCGGTDRFRFDDRDGRGTFICSQMDGIAGDGFRLIQHVYNCSFKEAITMVEYVLGGGVKESIPDPVVRSPVSPARRVLSDDGQEIWRKATAVPESYFKARGIPVPTHGVRLTGHSLVATICNEDARVMSLQFTPLNADMTARRGDRKFLAGHSTAGGYIVLVAKIDTNILCIAEGMETAMSLSLKVPNGSVRSVLNAGNMAKFKAPPWVKELHIAVDNDKAGIDAAIKCWELNRGIYVVAHISPYDGHDLNDWLLGEGNTVWDWWHDLHWFKVKVGRA